MRSACLLAFGLLFAALYLLPACVADSFELPQGLPWEPLETGSDASLRGVCAVGDGVVWASGSGGTVLRSVDHGDTWERVQVPGEGPNDLRDIEALGPQRAWVISITEPARILRTVDGGQTWEELYKSPNPASFFDSIALFEGGGGVVFGDPQDGVFEILRSDDGVRWEPVPTENIPPAIEGEAAFAASGTCVVTHGQRHAWIGTGGGAARVLRSTDAGRTWNAAQTPIRQAGEATGIYSVAFRSERHGVVVGGQYTEPGLAGDNAAYTTDGGETWSPAVVMPAGYRSGVVWATGQSLVAVGRAGCSASEDDGATWQTFSDDEGYFAVSTAPGEGVFAVGSEGRAARLRFE